MRVGRSLPWLLVLGALIALPAAADEVVVFTNGTVMPVSSHKVEKDMVIVELGGNSRMAFPLYMVDKIESYGRSVFLNPTYHPANQAVAVNTESGQRIVAAPVGGEGNVPSRFRGAPAATPVGRPATDEITVRDNVPFEGTASAAPALVERLAPDPVAVADRASRQLNALKDGTPVGQTPQSLSGSIGRRSNLVRLAPRPVPIATEPGVNPGGQKPGEGQKPSGPQTNPAPPPQDGNP